MTIPFTPPEFEKTAFNCPFCNAYARQVWGHTFYESYGTRGYDEKEHTKIAICSHCVKYSMWHNKKMIYPDNTGVQPPNLDLPEAIKNDYLEAGSIVIKSPRGAAALLRLCVQKLCAHLGESGKNLDDDIANLVKKGLPETIQKSLDIVRVIGNNAVHPGQIDLKDNTEVAKRLFELVNLIANVLITQPKEIEKLYSELPEGTKKAINKRDNKGTQ